MAENSTIAEPEQVSINTDPLSEQLPDVVELLPDQVLPLWSVIDQYPIVGALVIAAVFYLLAYTLRFLLFRSLEKLAGFTASTADDLLLQQLKKPIFTTVWAFGLAIAFVAAQLPMGTGPLVNLALSVIVASWMRAALKISAGVLNSLGGQTRFALIEPRTIPLFDLTAKLLIILFGSYVLLLIWGINPIGWLASAGIVGIAVGFAAKDTLANLFAGFFIVADAPYQIGDYINLDTGERGKVTAIGLRSTRLLTRDDVEITVPNGVIANAKIINESGGPYLKMRVKLAVGVAYGSDVDQVCEILQAIAKQHSEVCDQPAPRLRMRGFGASSLDFDLLVWISHPEDRGRIKHELFMQIYKAFEQAGIEIPYSKHDLYIKAMPDSTDASGSVSKEGNLD